MDQKAISEWVGSLDESERRAVLRDALSLMVLPLFYKWYFLLEGGYYEMSRNIAPLGVAVVVLLMGGLSFLLGVHPLASIILVIMGFVLGVVAVWEIQRRR